MKVKNLLEEVTKGSRGLLSSRKGVFCLLALAAMVYLGSIGHLDGIAFSAGCTMLGTIFCWTQSKSDLASQGTNSSFIESIRSTIKGDQ